MAYPYLCTVLPLAARLSLQWLMVLLRIPSLQDSIVSSLTLGKFQFVLTSSVFVFRGKAVSALPVTLCIFPSHLLLLTTPDFFAFIPFLFTKCQLPDSWRILVPFHLGQPDIQKLMLGQNTPQCINRKGSTVIQKVMNSNRGKHIAESKKHGFSEIIVAFGVPLNQMVRPCC